jgi:hypothetical protein
MKKIVIITSLLFLFSTFINPFEFKILGFFEIDKKPENKFKEIILERTSYYVNEDKYNETREFSDGTSCNDAYNTPNIVAFQDLRARTLNIKLGDTIIFKLPSGTNVTKIFRDRMSQDGEFREKNFNRCDFLINKDEKPISHKISIINIKRKKNEKRVKNNV